jgi:Fur family transcriptional regulator, stress-responsive regulator
MPDRLRSVGLRVTAARLAVLDMIPPGVHRDAEEVAAGVRQRLGRVSTQAVYDVLRALTDAGLLRRVEIPGSPAARYERWLHDNHHHLVCRSCGLAVDVDCAVGHAPCLEPGSAGGFVVDEAEVTFWGLCPTCQTDNDEGLRA